MTRFLRCGREAVLAEVDDLDAALALYAALRDARLPGVVDLVPAARTVLIRLDPAVTSPAEVRAATAALEPGGAGRADAGTVEIPVVYDGPDLAEVAGHLGVTEDEVVARHTAARWTVAFAGFAPGFGYLTGDDPTLDVPRRSSPRTRIPAGSVGLAGRFSGVYPNESPGGWQLIGSTTEPMWDLTRPEPALLVPGVRVIFKAVR
ncbi:5-oxoprolinase subunit B family protein [Pseudosporangium ferrugineum]|uniref:KipI family sensor histidine kinase inhibitor n=1 Tax=Pseudosporangium ferrugineum TaxID=439699 RepID=A0A2T0RU65_9ACTN|nr:allophanate hydrolase subunit 1 [Pseudosporangium ferrugineum]PRY24739.1 KipI family sensor histidine kinase inhibitor [Pseudosporangium ferrugineum]